MDEPTEQLASYAVDLRYDEITPHAIHAVERRLLDSVACALAALRTQPVSSARTLARTEVGTPAAQVLFTGEATTPERAAYTNSLMVGYWDLSDTYLHGGHPSAALPAVLAMSEALGSSGRDTLLAAVIAYESFCALSDAEGMGAGSGQALRIGISSALGVGKLLGLTAAQMADAVSLAVAGNVGLNAPRNRRLTMWRPGAGASGAHNGLLAARMASHGLTGPHEPFQALGGGVPGTLPPMGGRGRDFRIERSHLKVFTAEYHAQAGIWAALALREQVRPDDIARLVIHTYAHAVGGIADSEGKWHPTDVDTALHSLPYMVAVALLDGDVTPAQLAPERLAADDVRALVDRMEVLEDPALTAPYPGVVGTRLEAVTSTGEPLSIDCMQPKGHFGNPLSDDEIEEKFRRYADGLLAPPAQEETLERIWGLESEPDVRGLLSALRVEDGIVPS